MRVFLLLAVFGLFAIGCSAVAPSGALAPSFLEAASASSARLPHCTDIVDEYIKLEKATEKDNKAIKRDWTCAAMANKLWTLLAGHTTTHAVQQPSGIDRKLREMATKFAHPKHSATTATLFGINNLVDCDANGNKVCQCTAPANTCANKWALRASTFYIVEIGTKPQPQRTYVDALAHILLVYVHADATTVSIYQASAGVTPLVRKTSTLANFIQGLSSLITLQTANALTKPQAALLDQFCLLDKKDPTGFRYLKEVLAVSVGGGYSDANCQNLANNLANAKNEICRLICNNAATKTVNKRAWLIKKVQVEVCDC